MSKTQDPPLRQREKPHCVPSQSPTLTPLNAPKNMPPAGKNWHRQAGKDASRENIFSALDVVRGTNQSVSQDVGEYGYGTNLQQSVDS